jgi:hypothetical protein
MYTEDFILRMISQATAVLAGLLRLKQAGQRQEAMQTVDQALEVLLGLRAPLFRQLDEARMLDLLVLQGRLDVDRLAVLADIFYEEADLQEQEGHEEECLVASRRALRFYLESALDIYRPDLKGMPPEIMAKIETLRTRLDGVPGGLSHLTLETRLALVDYYERLLNLHPDHLAAAGLTQERVSAVYRAVKDNLEI